MKKLSLVLILAVFFGLRSYRLSSDLLFQHDQGMHSLAIWQIWHDHKFSLLGHPSDADGLYHAPIYYWLMAPAYLLGRGNPVYASLFQILLETLSVIFFYLAAKKLFNEKTALYSSLIYAFSYSLVSYSRWLVNVTPIFPTANLLLYLYSKKDSSHPFLSGLLIGLMTQFNAAIGIFQLPYNLYRLRRQPKDLLISLVAFILPATPIILFDLRHHFVISQAIGRFFSSGVQSDYLSKLLAMFTTFGTEIAHLISMPYPIFALVLFAFALVSLKSQKKFVYPYLFLTLLFLSIGVPKAFNRGVLSFFFVAILPLITLLIGHFLANLRLGFVLLIFILVLNFKLDQNIYLPTNALIPIGDANLITISDRRQVLDWVYQQANHQPFANWYYSLPLYQDYAWDYLYLWYGQAKYGYLPEKTANFHKSDLHTAKTFFVLFEPDYDNPARQSEWLKQATREFGQPIAAFSSHDLYAFAFRVTHE